MYLCLSDFYFIGIMELNLAILCKSVARIAMEIGHYQKEERKRFKKSDIEHKQTNDYVSYVDKQSEKRIVEALKKLLPEAGFITEEGSASYQDETYCWIIDPLDGTTNYIHDYAPYCVSIALWRGNNPLLAVIYEVCCDECFTAWKNGGAWLNGKRIHVSGTKDLNQACMLIEFPYDAHLYKETALHLVNSLYGKVAALRMNGSAAASMCYVAAGRVDGWMESFINAWDFAAATLLVTEAGGKVTNLEGGQLTVKDRNVIATNAIFHSVFEELISECPSHKK